MHMPNESTADYLVTFQRRIERRADPCENERNAFWGLRYALPASGLLWAFIIAAFQLFS
jgi:hypothetical protein